MPASAPAQHSPARKVVVIQDGTRLHYAVPVGLKRRGALERVYTDWYAKRRTWNRLLAWAADRFRPGAGGRMLARRHPELDDRLIYTKPTLAWIHARSRPRFANPEAHYAFGSRLIADWVREKGYGRASAMFGFVRNLDPSLAAHARSKGLAVVADQMIAPMEEEQRQQLIQLERFPDWATAVEPSDPDLVRRIEAETWDMVHHVTCASEYVRRSLLEAGVRPEKVTVVPYPLDAGGYEVLERPRREGFTVGCVGAVGLRKGAPYVFAVARRLPGVQFRLIGPVTVDVARLDVPSNVTLVGPVARERVPEELARLDAYFLPTTCEGSAVSVLEAMASGLPVVTSPNSGSPVRHTVDGFVYPYDDVDSLAGSLDTLAADAALRTGMGRSAAIHVRSFTIDRYADGLLSVVSSVLSHLSPEARTRG